MSLQFSKLVDTPRWSLTSSPLSSTYTSLTSTLAISIEDLGDTLGVLADNKSFICACILHESTSAGVGMLLLIGCPGLNKSDVFGPNPEEIEISILNFHQAMVNARNLMEERPAQNSWPDTNDAVHVSNLADELWNRNPTISPDFIKSRQEVSYRQVSNAAEVVTFLAEPEISFFPDMLRYFGKYVQL